MAPGARNKFATPCSNLTSFGSKCTVLKKSAHDIVGIFWAPRSDSVPGELCPLAPLVTSLVLCNENRKIFRKLTIIKSERHEHLQFSKTIRHGSCTDCQQRLQAAFRFLRVVLCHFRACPTRFFGVDLCLFC